MVRRASLLGRAMNKRRPTIIPGYEDVLRLLEKDRYTEAAWDTLAGMRKPAADLALAIAVLDAVALSYIQVPFALRSAERRAEIEARFAGRAAALDVLEAAFKGPPVVRVIEGPEDDSGSRSLPAKECGFHSNIPPALRMALEVWRAQPKDPDAPEPSFSDPYAQAYHEHLRIARTAPAALRDMRRYLEREKEGAIAATETHLTSRKRAGGNVGMREFTFALSEFLRELVKSPRHEFVTTIVAALFGSPTNVVTFEATRAVSVRERARRARKVARDGV